MATWTFTPCCWWGLDSPTLQSPPSFSILHLPLKTVDGRSIFVNFRRYDNEMTKIKIKRYNRSKIRFMFYVQRAWGECRGPDGESKRCRRIYRWRASYKQKNRCCQPSIHRLFSSYIARPSPSYLLQTHSWFLYPSVSSILRRNLLINSLEWITWIMNTYRYRNRITGKNPI